MSTGVSMETLSTEPSLSSPFALMLPETARAIVARAAAMQLPTRLCSPLSNPRTPGATFADDDED